jgi:hypothetical protein
MSLLGAAALLSSVSMLVNSLAAVGRIGNDAGDIKAHE